MKSTYSTTQNQILERLHTAFNFKTSPDAVLAFDNNFNILYINPVAERLYGWNLKEIVNKSEQKVFKTRLLDTTIEEYLRTLYIKKTWTGEMIQLSKSGRKIFILTTLTTIKNERGNDLGYVAINRDVTEYKHIEYNLRFLSASAKTLSSSLDYETTLQRVTELAVPRIADWCSIELLHNEKLEQVAISHRDPKKVKWAIQLRKKYPPDLSSNIGIAKVLKKCKTEFYPFIPDEILSRTTRNPKQLALMQKIGFVSVIIVPIIIDHRAIGAICLVSAESHRHYTKSDVQMAEKLASRASLAVQNARLYQSAEREIKVRRQTEERLKELENRKDNFISMASHELKTPITTLKIYTDLLNRQLKQKNDSTYDKTLTMMTSQIDKLSTLIADLLNLSKIQAGKLEFRMQHFDIVSLAKNICEQIQPSISHTLKISGTSKHKVYGDPERIGQVLINLLTNAVKYSPTSNKINIKIDSNDTGVVVAVKDFGIGVEKEHREKIFERFYQVADKEKTFPGLGMGLYISSEIINRHNGKLWVKSVKHKGSTFIFSLPFKQKK